MPPYAVIHVVFTLLTPRPSGETKMTRLFFLINVSRYVLTIGRHLSSIPCMEDINNIHCANLLCKVVFYPTRSDPSWWYVIQTAPRSRHIFDEGGVEEVVPEQAIQMDDETNVSSKGGTSDDSSNGSDDVSSEGCNDDDSSPWLRRLAKTVLV